MRTSAAGVFLALLVAAASPGLGQTKPADDRAAIADAARAVINAARALDQDALSKLYAPAKNAEQARMIRDEIWLTLRIQKLRSAAEKKFGPAREPDLMEEDENWNWGVLPVEQFDSALKKEPTILEVNQDEATVWAMGGLKFRKQPDGRWLRAVDEEDSGIAIPDEPAERAALEDRFSDILRDLDADRIKSAGDVRARIAAIFGM